MLDNVSAFILETIRLRVTIVIERYISKEKAFTSFGGCLRYTVLTAKILCITAELVSTIIETTGGALTNVRSSP